MQENLFPLLPFLDLPISEEEKIKKKKQETLVISGYEKVLVSVAGIFAGATVLGVRMPWSPRL